MSHIRLDVDDKYTLEIAGKNIIATNRGLRMRDYDDDLILAMMTRIIELQRIVASNRSSESEPTAEEWAIAEQRAGEAKNDNTYIGSES